ncbi:MAG: CHRD domain-containing protein [Bacteroidota bacterium]|nr:CHRD domain-containing protein [Bacteroidota bacterium]
MKHFLRFVLLVLAFTVAAFSQEVFFRIKLDSTSTGTTSTGKGSGYAILSSDRKSLQYDVTVNKLAGTISAAHFHYLPTSGVIHGVTFTGNTTSGTWTNIPDTIAVALLSGNIYLNVHSSTAPGGEIRGIVDVEQFGFPLKLDGPTAGTTSAGRGSGYVVFNKNSDTGSVSTISYRATYAGLQGTITGAHFHALPSGNVVHPVAFVDSTLDETWTNPADSILTLFLHQKMYLNIHSSVSPGGEIRATGNLVGEIPFAGILDGTQAGTASTGKGTAWAILRPDLSVKYNATYAKLLGTFSGAHFHTADGGGVIKPVTFSSNNTFGDWTGLSDKNLQDLLRGRVYLNVHSSVNPGGEIRANMTLQNGLFEAVLDGTQAGTTSKGKGTAWVYFTMDSVRYHATIAGLEGTFSGSHFHTANGGGIVKPVTFIDSTTTGYWNLGSSHNDLLSGKIYLNIHSSINPGGEIRGNFTLGTGTVTSVIQQISTAAPNHFALDQNYPNPFNPSTTINYRLTASSNVTLKVYDLLGKEIATLVNQEQTAGGYSVKFDAPKFASGIYFYQLRAGNFVQMKKMMLVK